MLVCAKPLGETVQSAATMLNWVLHLKVTLRLMPGLSLPVYQQGMYTVHKSWTSFDITSCFVLFFVFFKGNEWLLDHQVLTGSIKDLSQPLCISAKLPVVMKETNGSPSLTLAVWVYYCTEAGKACMMKAASFSQPLQINASSGEGEVIVELTHAF